MKLARRHYEFERLEDLELVPPPIKHWSSPCNGSISVKLDEFRGIQKKQARCRTCYRQEEGINFKESFAPVASIKGYMNFSSVCLFNDHGRLSNGCEDYFLNVICRKDDVQIQDVDDDTPCGENPNRRDKEEAVDSVIKTIMSNSSDKHKNGEGLDLVKSKALVAHKARSHVEVGERHKEGIITIVTQRSLAQAVTSRDDAGNPLCTFLIQWLILKI
ncbi:hypothetical protein Tco_0410706 [Tanacetum coccineum]